MSWTSEKIIPTWRSKDKEAPKCGGSSWPNMSPHTSCWHVKPKIPPATITGNASSQCKWEQNASESRAFLTITQVFTHYSTQNFLALNASSGYSHQTCWKEEDEEMEPLVRNKGTFLRFRCLFFSDFNTKYLCLRNGGIREDLPHPRIDLDVSTNLNPSTHFITGAIRANSRA